MAVNYMSGQRNNMLMQRYGLSTPSPLVPVRSDPRSWWKYTHKVVSDQMKKARDFSYGFDFDDFGPLLDNPNHTDASLRAYTASIETRRNINYTLLADEDNAYIGNAGRYDPRFDYSPASLDEIPWKSIALALFLLVLGCGLLLLSFFIFTGHMGGNRSQAYSLLGLGALTFLPGFYETRIAYYSWRGAQGYRYAAIPNY